MDTVGDAYVVVGFLQDAPPGQDGGGENGEGEQQATFVPIVPGSGWGEAGGDDGARAAARAAAAAAACGDVLAAARAMILALRDYRRRTGSALHCRVGLALGDVVAGVLGHLQPRCAIGEGERVQHHDEVRLLLAAGDGPPMVARTTCTLVCAAFSSSSCSFAAAAALWQGLDLKSQTLGFVSPASLDNVLAQMGLSLCHVTHAGSTSLARGSNPQGCTSRRAPRTPSTSTPPSWPPCAPPSTRRPSTRI